MDIDRITIETADYMVKAAELEVALANTFPLNLMPQLLEATKIDLAIAKKMRDIAQIEADARGTENEADIRLKCANRRKDIYAQKYKAAIDLTKLDALKAIERHVNLLGKQSKKKKRQNTGKKMKKNKIR
jgi:hypothetical protein